MKKGIKFLTVALIASATLASCSQKPEDIKISDLDSVCDYVNAMESVVDAVIKVRTNKDLQDLSEEEKEYLDVLKKKLNEIGESAEKFSRTEAEECSNFELLQKKIQKEKKSFE